MRDNGDVEGVAGEGAHVETAHVIGEEGDYAFDDFQGKLCDEGRACGIAVERGRPERILRILARLRYQRRFASNSITV